MLKIIQRILLAFLVSQREISGKETKLLHSTNKKPKYLQLDKFHLLINIRQTF